MKRSQNNLLLRSEEIQRRDMLILRSEHKIHCREDLFQKRLCYDLKFANEDTTCMLGSDIKFITINCLNGLYPVPFVKRI
jgi:hypothetical protein